MDNILQLSGTTTVNYNSFNYIGVKSTFQQPKHKKTDNYFAIIIINSKNAL